MLREIINENYHLKVFNRDLKGKTANSKNPKNQTDRYCQYTGRDKRIAQP